MLFFYLLKIDVEDDLTSIAEQEQDLAQDRNTSKRRYSRLSDGYERLKTVLPSVKDKRRVSKVSVLYLCYVFMFTDALLWDLFVRRLFLETCERSKARSFGQLWAKLENLQTPNSPDSKAEDFADFE